MRNHDYDVIPLSIVRPADGRRGPWWGLTVLFWIGALAACSGGDARGGAPRVALGPVDGRDLPPADTGRVQVGDRAPDFSLESYDDGVITLSDFRGKKDVIMVFYRGYW